MVVKGMEDQVIPLMEEYKPVINTSDCEKGMIKGFVEMEESDAVQATSIVAQGTITLCLILAIFLILSRNFMAKHENIIMVILVPLYLFIQFGLCSVAITFPVDNRVFGILFMLVIFSAVSVIEVSIFSWTVASIFLIFWAIMFPQLLIRHWKVISTEDVVFSKGIQRFIAIICVISILYTIKSIVYNIYV
ncbi:hypothetical protein MtrunA17_Chr8g0335871 [Medicago truncatula]|uniref:Transmembrane protein, putative n=1 Tax=Medicago truncatula TaxID=3880 RepID=G7ZVT3_MEDTR|nr:transmembrane protein, putative [Medicago truncatula]RHN38686.1 hypothetical protein MtrunA17_Chr8g0335871 [Medicago truncatula]